MTTDGLAYLQNWPLQTLVPHDAGTVAGPGAGEKFCKSTE